MEISNYIHVLNKTCLFKDFNCTNLCKLFENIDYKIIDVKKDILLHQTNDTCTQLIIILKGNVLLEKFNSFNNKSLTIYNFRESDIIGANTLFAENNYFKLDVYSKSNCTLLYIPKQEILNICEKDICFLQNFLGHLSKKSQFLLQKIDFLSNKNLRTSIINFLEYKYSETNSKIINIGMSKTELAKVLGVERTSLSRELKSMKDDGLIDFDKTSITIVDKLQ